jgi:hypothetical protein
MGRAGTITFSSEFLRELLSEAKVEYASGWRELGNLETLRRNRNYLALKFLIHRS